MNNLLEVYCFDGRKSRSTQVSVCQEFCCVHGRESPANGHVVVLPNILLCRLAASSLIQGPVSKILTLVFALGTDCLKMFLQWAQGSSSTCFALWCLCDFRGGVAMPGPCWFSPQVLSVLRRRGQLYPKVWKCLE